MQRALFLTLLLVVTGAVFAADEGEDEYPSPDGHLAFRATRDEEKHTVDLIEKDTGKVLQRVAESEQGRFSYWVLWQPGGKRFALRLSESRLSAWVEVWVRAGAKFREVSLPEFAEPKIPKKYENEKRVWHWAAINFCSPERWTKSGSLVVECESTTDGNGSYITAMRTVVFGFDRAGKAKILSNENKVTAHFE